MSRTLMTRGECLRRIRLTPFLLLASVGAIHSLRAQESLPSDRERARVVAEIGAIVEAPEYANARFGVLVVSEPDGEVWYEREAERGFIPASNVKLVSTALALRELGPSFRFETTLWRTGEVDSDGVLQGDLVLRGGADPTLGGRMEEEQGEHLAALVKAVRSLGVRRVAGRIVGDDDIQPEELMGEGWQWDYQEAWYAAQFGGLNLRENVFHAVVEPTSAGGFTLRADPPCSLLELHCRVVAALPGEEPSVRFERVRGTNRFVASGRLRTEPWRETLAVENPTLHAASALRDALLAEGIEVRDAAWDLDDLGPFAYDRTHEEFLVARHRSKPLAEIVGVTNRVSQNLYAEQLARAAVFDGDRFGHVRETRRLLDAWLGELGIDPRTCYLADGSGMSRRNLLTPRALVAILRSMGRSELGEIYLDSLSHAGVNGTLRSRLSDLPEEAQVRAKTGSLSRVRALSGHFLRDSELRFTFSILVNDHTRVSSRRVVDDIDRIVRALALVGSPR